MLMISCFTLLLKQMIEVEIQNDGDFGVVFEEDYFHSDAYVRESETLISDLIWLIDKYKSEEYILNGGSVSEDEIRNAEENLYNEYQINSNSYNPNLSEEQNFAKFKEEYAEKIAKAKENLIKEDLKEFNQHLQNISDYKNPLYYVSDGEHEYTNAGKKDKEQFTNFPAYMMFTPYKQEFYPKEVYDNKNLFRINHTADQFEAENSVIYIAYTKDFLNQNIKEWQQDQREVKNSIVILFGYLAGFIAAFVYLAMVIGRDSFKDEKLRLNVLDRLFTDINLAFCLGLITIWVAIIESIYPNLDYVLIPISLPIAALGFLLIMSLVKHMKNKTLFKHTLLFWLIAKLVRFVGDVYKNGNVAVKTVLIVVGYPLLVAATFFIFPITLGLAAWFALKKIKSFNAIKTGVEKIKKGNTHHHIEIAGHGEFADLAENINTITDGLKKAVHNELKSERLKTELITNVSHDIRTPLTSIITYVDLLKQEQDPAKVDEYIEVLVQKANRLKVLTDDLFEAAKASSGNIPVHLERIDVESLITQGLGEVNDKIEALGLNFRLNYPDEKLYVNADGKLLWRSIENLLSNIFKYALRQSRVYIDIEDLGNEVRLSFKNISAYELNISEDELMERFKRGDESRGSQGSGLGLSIAKSLIENQTGKFEIQIDGDLFKAMITLPKYN